MPSLWLWALEPPPGLGLWIPRLRGRHASCSKARRDARRIAAWLTARELPDGLHERPGMQSNSPVSRVSVLPPGLAPSANHRGIMSTSTALYDDGLSEHGSFDFSQKYLAGAGRSHGGPRILDLVFSNIPPIYTEEMSLNEWSDSPYDFFYLPRGKRGNTNLGTPVST